MTEVSFMDLMMTVEELAARLQVKTSWVYSHADELGVYRLGKYLRFSWPRVLDSLDRVDRSLGQSDRNSIGTLTIMRNLVVPKEEEENPLE
jgi:hypothetical protein